MQPRLKNLLGGVQRKISFSVPKRLGLSVIPTLRDKNISTPRSILKMNPIEKISKPNHRVLTKTHNLIDLLIDQKGKLI
jgi:hypothetical protein